MGNNLSELTELQMYSTISAYLLLTSSLQKWIGLRKGKTFGLKGPNIRLSFNAQKDCFLYFIANC